MSGAFGSPQHETVSPFAKLWLQISNRTNWRTALGESGLPDEVKSLIHGVVRGSRLMWFEQSEIAEELIAHFVDGHRIGKSFQELVIDFGDPQLAAVLIRNSKIRNRPMIMKFVRVGAWGGLGLGTAYLAMLAFFHLGKPNPVTDFTAKINKSVMETREQDRAWPLYRDSWTKHEFCEGPGGHFEEILHRDGPDDTQPPRLIRPTDPGWETAVQKLEHSQDLLIAFRRGGKLPALGVTLHADLRKYSPEDFKTLFPNRSLDEEYSDSLCLDGISDTTDKLLVNAMFAILLPHMQSFRKAARILHVDTRLAIEQGDTDRVVENIETVFGLARQASETPFLVCGLVGLAVAEHGFAQIEEILLEHPDFLSADQLEKIQESVAQLQMRKFIKFDGEVASMNDMIQRVYSDDGNGDGRMTPEGLEVIHWSRAMFDSGADDIFELDQVFFKARSVTGPAFLLFAASRKELVEKLDAIMDEIDNRFDSPIWEDDMADVEEMVTEEKHKFGVLANFFPGFMIVRNRLETVLAYQDATLVALATHRFRHEFSQFPEIAADLVPDWIGEIPLDRMNGELVEFTASDDGFVIYSVGNDGDDDGGRPAMDGANARTFILSDNSAAGDGDWILWPQRDEFFR